MLTLFLFRTAFWFVYVDVSAGESVEQSLGNFQSILDSLMSFSH